MVIRRIENLKRLTNTVNGNPRYRVTFTDGSSAITKSNAAFCGVIENKEMAGDVEVTFTSGGRIATMTPVQ